MSRCDSLLTFSLLTTFLWVGCAQQGAQDSKASDPPPKRPEPVTLYPVQQGGKWGFIDKSGVMTIAPQFEAAGQFREELANVTLNKTCGYVGPEGQMKIAAQFATCAGFVDGLAFVFTGDQGERKADGTYIDHAGKPVVPPRFFGGGSFSEGLAMVFLEEHVVTEMRPLYAGSGKVGPVTERTENAPQRGYIDSKGQQITTVAFTDGAQFAGGLAAVKVGKRWGFLDKTGNLAIEPQFDEAGSFKEGLAPVRSATKWGFIDATAKLVLPAQYDDAAAFTSGLAPVKTGKKWGYIDKSGATIIAPEFDEALGFEDERAAVRVGKKWGYIDKAGTLVVQPQFEEVAWFYKGLGRVASAGKTGYVDATGKVVWPLSND